MLVVAAIIFILFGFLFSPLRTSRFSERDFRNFSVTAASRRPASCGGSAAAVSTGFVMIAAAGGRIGNLEASHHEGLHGVVRQAFHIWADGDPCRLQAPDGTLADIPADDKFHVIILQKCNNGVMSLPVGLHHLG